MSSKSENPTPPKTSNKHIYFFVIGICLIAALILSLLSSSFQEKQAESKKIDQSRQMLIAAKILNYDGIFLVSEGDEYHTAYYDEEQQILIPTNEEIKASSMDILAIYLARLQPMLVDIEGTLYTFEEKNISYENYLEDHQKDGYSKLPLKLIYKINPNVSPSQTQQSSAIGYIIPINGYGLWDAIYGYLAIRNDGDTVIGTTWYQHAETAGLGAVIALPSWQEQFHNKVIFQESPDGQTDFARAPIGIVVVKGKVEESLGNSPKAKSAVDGISGASLTGVGVTNAYRNVLEQYRPFLIKLHEEHPNG